MMARATANGWPSGRATATRTEPASAVPSDDPRLETLRDKPEISPWSASGKLDWTTLTDDVSMTPTPAPNNSSPGIQDRMPEFARTRDSSKIMPTAVVAKPAMISHRCGCRRANLSAPAEVARMSAGDSRCGREVTRAPLPGAGQHHAVSGRRRGAAAWPSSRRVSAPGRPVGSLAPRRGVRRERSCRSPASTS
jgi:hypothetical protein